MSDPVYEPILSGDSYRQYCDDVVGSGEEARQKREIADDEWLNTWREL